MKRLLTISVLLVLVASIAQAASRTWKSSNGRFSIKAELLDFKDGKLIAEERRHGDRSAVGLVV